MTLKGEGRVFTNGDANTLFISVPARVAIDSAFPFDSDEEEVIIRIDPENERVIVEKEDEE